jgi:Uma2 family endonuclease
MLEAGILSRHDRIELIDGEVVVLAAKGARHEVVRNELVVSWARQLPADVKFAEEPPLRLGPHDEPEPDITLFPARLRVPDVRGDSVLLVVEIADTSLSYDLQVKAPLYASYSVREYWVIDAATLETHVHRQPQATGCAERRLVASTADLVPLLVPALGVKLADLDVG